MSERAMSVREVNYRFVYSSLHDWKSIYVFFFGGNKIIKILRWPNYNCKFISGFFLRENVLSIVRLKHHSFTLSPAVSSPPISFDILSPCTSKLLLYFSYDHQPKNKACKIIFIIYELEIDAFRGGDEDDDDEKKKVI